jgi:hypothetical protein
MPADILVDRPDCPMVLRDICFRMLQKDPDDRYQSAREVAEALRAWRKQWLAKEGAPPSSQELAAGAAAPASATVASAPPPSAPLPAECPAAEPAPAEAPAPTPTEAPAQAETALSHLDDTSRGRGEDAAQPPEAANQRPAGPSERKVPIATRGTRGSAARRTPATGSGSGPLPPSPKDSGTRRGPDSGWAVVEEPLVEVEPAGAGGSHIDLDASIAADRRSASASRRSSIKGHRTPKKKLPRSFVWLGLGVAVLMVAAAVALSVLHLPSGSPGGARDQPTTRFEL